jgi:hypothetical protein
MDSETEDLHGFSEGVLMTEVSELVGMSPDQILKNPYADPDVKEAAKDLVSYVKYQKENGKKDRQWEIPTFTFLNMELYTRTSLWMGHASGIMELKMVPCRRGRMQGAANFTRKSKVSRVKLILWFINSKGNNGARFSEIQRFICELNGMDYDRRVWETDWNKLERFRDTGKRIWALPGQTYQEAMKSHGGEWFETEQKLETVDERPGRQGPITMSYRRVYRGYYCDVLFGNHGILSKYCKRVSHGLYMLNDVGQEHILTAAPLTRGRG